MLRHSGSDPGVARASVSLLAGSSLNPASANLALSVMAEGSQAFEEASGDKLGPSGIRI